MESCARCKYQNRSNVELPCLECTQNRAIDYFTPKTNADRIRNMTDEELEEHLWKMAEESPCYICAFRNGWLCEKPHDVSCHGGVLKWLKSEVGCE